MHGGLKENGMNVFVHFAMISVSLQITNDKLRMAICVKHTGQ